MLLSTAVLLNDLRPWAVGVLLVWPTIPYTMVSVTVGVASVVLPRWVFVRIDNAMNDAYQRLVLFVFETLSGVRLSLYGDFAALMEKSESALVISNHQCSVDWAVTDMLAVRQGSLGVIRYVLKDALQYVPLFGWYFYQRGCVYVRRHGNFRQDAAIRELRYLNEMKPIGIPYWLVLFPEGTRFNGNKPKAVEESKKFARERNLQELEHVLTPRSRGLTLALSELRESLDAVYDVTIAYEQTRQKGQKGLAPDMSEFVCGPLRHKGLHVHVERIPLIEVPLEETELKLWLHQRFVKKDRLLSQFYGSTGDGDAFPGLFQKDSSLALRETIVPTVFFTSLFIPLIFHDRFRAFSAVFASTSAVLMIGWLKLKKAV